MLIFVKKLLVEVQSVQILILLISASVFAQALSPNICAQYITLFSKQNQTYIFTPILFSHIIHVN